MRITQFIIIAALVAGCATTPDSIERLVSRLSSDHSWERGDIFSLGVPAPASTEQVVSAVLKIYHMTSYRILTVREVRIPGSLPNPYIAVLTDTDEGRKVVLLNHVGPNRDWWYRVFDEWSWPFVPEKKSA
jgi:hypothetical protein